MEKYLRSSEAIDWQDPSILALAKAIASRHETQQEIAKACFEWVRDEIHHSVDYRMNPVTCRASAVLKYKTGYCYAKSHLLAALLRANGIPAGLCYQRLSIDDRGAPYCLHGLNAVYLDDIGWYRIDARGDRAGIKAEFLPPKEHLAYRPRLPEEADFQSIFSDPLPVVVKALENCTQWDEMLQNLPDIPLQLWEQYNLALNANEPI